MQKDFKFFIKPLLQYRYSLVSLIFALVIMSIAQSALLLFLGPFLRLMFTSNKEQSIVLRELIPKEANFASFDFILDYYISFSSLVYLIPLGLFIAGSLRSIAYYLYEFHINILALNLANHWRERLFSAILAMPFIKIQARSSSQWMSVIMNDVANLQLRFSDICGAFLRDGIVTLTALFTMLFIHPPSFLVLAIFAPLVAKGMGHTGGKISLFTAANQRLLGIIVAQVLEMRQRFLFIKAQKGEKNEEVRFAKSNEEYYLTVRRSFFLRSFFAPLLELIGFLSFAFFIFLYAKKIVNFEASTLLLFFATLGMMLRPLRNIGEQLGKYHEILGQLKESFSILQVNEVKEQPRKFFIKNDLNLAVDDFSFPLDKLSVGQLANGKPIFSALDIAISSGKIIAVVGPSGAGKSTFAKCLAGLYEPTIWQSNVLWTEFCSNVVYVSQNPYFFSGSISENLFYGIDSCDLSLLSRVLDIVELSEFATDLKGKQKLSTLDPRFSGGQLQRFAIARALLTKRPICVFDEITANLDPSLEQKILSALFFILRKQKRSAIFVTHRLSKMEEYDEVFFVEDHKLRLCGTHKNLLNNPRYLEYVSK